ncbi:MAG: transposase [Planctomycetes bacterium]|nr:transposase [Planctomycetota bacterium]
MLVSYRNWGPHVHTSSRPFLFGHICSPLCSRRQFPLSASIIADLCRLRWQIELFFRWFKKVLQADRPLSLKQHGLTLVVYCALIASLLVVLWTGRKPTKRTYEMICFTFLGWVSDAELAAHIERLQPATK